MALALIRRGVAAHPLSRARGRALSMLNADESTGYLKVYHYVNLALLGAAPLAFVAPPPLTFPIDLFLAVGFPLHAHIGMNAVISDYVKKFLGKGAVQPARFGMLGVTTVTTLGLLKLTLTGPGLIATIKGLWKAPPKKQ
ncbi:hypothetical protein T492DRAFT_924870 [Pavlovales sp. CCMP2436]|nr:hypothetical protein T492DRAFT_924870 [Pavlovales sp. CCMP2436]|mmetsp:Transcript_28126/g.70793  ORF Transcript_28126/g.70793 Transcript_28126/m.70793 type:complete len:140 (-) Transcript_28126:185-604(-)